jgi:hypothetical protein
VTPATDHRGRPQRQAFSLAIAARMFAGLDDLARRRSLLQAFGFYLVCLAAMAVVVGVTGGLFAVADTGSDFRRGLSLGSYLAFVCSPALGLLVLKRKRRLSSLQYA